MPVVVSCKIMEENEGCVCGEGVGEKRRRGRERCRDCVLVFFFF